LWMRASSLLRMQVFSSGNGDDIDDDNIVVGV
jgi:hypothetical protein